MRISNEYLCGLIDGEGCFLITLLHSRKAKYGIRTRLYMKIHMCYLAESMLLNIINDLRIGNLYRYKNVKKNEKLKSVEYIITSENDIETLINILDKYPPIIKRREYDAFKRAFYLMKNKKHFTKEGILELISIRDEMNVETRNSRRKDKDEVLSWLK